MGMIEIRVPETEEELEQAQQAKDEAWHFLNPERAGSVRGAYESFREGFLTAFMDGKAAGNFILTRVDYDITKPSDKNWEELCLNNFNLQGDTLYGAGLGVSPKYAGKGIGYRLVYAALQKTIEMNCKQFVLGCRIPDYHQYSNIPVEQYITLKRKDGEYLDKELRFYSRCGLRFLKPLPGYMDGDWADPDSLNYGVLSVWTNPFYREEK